MFTISACGIDFVFFGQFSDDQVLTQNKSRSTLQDVPKGFLMVYMGKAQKKRFLVPVSYLGQPSFQDLLSMAETPKI
ncbi:unnamed protein product [Linum tenue]|uniref:Uncharacterized protein n=1 Tax=Linum tenue TaxID=586396 RepID=A0AAV0NAM4_9ROSI|nr:unnamed protein product [Linum tenue]